MQYTNPKSFMQKRPALCGQFLMGSPHPYLKKLYDAIDLQIKKTPIYKYDPTLSHKDL